MFSAAHYGLGGPRAKSTQRQRQKVVLPLVVGIPASGVLPLCAARMVHRGANAVPHWHYVV
jgi:hypothetical protein